ncbi:hypothetical protein DXT97_12575 [Agrobacterium tumefaciens]|uniref:hypothetical protein n=1 Tax=Agrobacterium tumefaciens TaxID=358 RepID=UPI00129738A5|nr:hypothetical protein [Agrobacterium tumefaciens]MQB37627.1 hypothetical protein [Agrobacterium tumefaciens]
MECNFTVGQKVVCVQNWFAEQHLTASVLGITLPVEGGVYTIRSIDVLSTDDVHVRLDEIHNPELGYSDFGFIEQAFCQTCFRPVVQRKTDISIFTDMLIEQKQPVQA